MPAANNPPLRIPPNPQEYPFYNIEQLIAVQDNPNIWIVENMIPRVGRTILYGKGGTYKSLLVFDIAVAVASAGKMLEAIPIQAFGPVALISTEGSLSSNKKRVFNHLRARNILPTNATVRLHYSHTRGRIDRPQVREALEASIQKIQPLMLVLDPFVNFFSGNENNANEVNAFTEVVDYLIDRYKLSVVIIHHASKKGELRGSSAIWGWGDCILCSNVKRKVRIPGLELPVDVMTIVGEKVRDGVEDELFSAVPFINSSIGMVTFGFHNGLNPEGVILAYLKQAIFHILRESGRPMHRQQLVDVTRSTHDRVSKALDWLLLDRLVEPAEVRVPTDSSGVRTRGVPGWRVTVATSKVDAAGAMLQVIRQVEDDRMPMVG